MHVPGEGNTGPAQAVAITGAAVRFPGASDAVAFHQLSMSGRRMFRELARPVGADPAACPGGQRGAAAGGPGLLAALLDDGGRVFGRDDDLTDGISARHILAAETANAALADIPPAGRAVGPGRIGVFIADLPEPGTADVSAWVQRHLGTPAAGDPLPGFAGGLAGPASGGPLRTAGAWSDLVLGTIDAVSLSHGLSAMNGASVVNGTAIGNGLLPRGQRCSLRAIAAACEALNAGEFDLVLAGGVAKGLGGWTSGRSLSAGEVRVYDASPTGTLPGEGCGVVALMRAADARAAELPSYAEIAGWHYAGPATPHKAVLPEAYLRAGIDPADIQFVEGHGAATAADDLTELSALLDVLGRRGGSAGRCVLGSVSANIGDTRAAAGVAALLKTAFAMTEDTIPPTAGCVRPNRLLRGDKSPFRLPSAPERWPQTPVQLAAVNTLGTAPHPGAPRSGPVHVVLRRERDATRRPGRRRKPSPPAAAVMAQDAPGQPEA
jgi:enediyne polyketide synthase